MSNTAYITHRDYVQHTLARHPEFAGRIERIWAVLEGSGVLNDLLSLDATTVSDETLKLVHTNHHIARIKDVSQRGGGWLDADTYSLAVSHDIARLSAGGAVLAVDTIMTGKARNALAAIRPPGHHATPNRAMGFCLFSNAAVAARHAQHTYDNIERVMIVDYDVHHGNGTQDVFYDDPSVLFVSSHQYPFYPGTGGLNETGEGAGTGFTLNMPLPAGAGNQGLAALYEQILWPAARRFKPDLVIVSAGYDAHWADPLAMIQLDLAGYAHLSRQLVAMADDLCDGRVIFVLEGGYDLEVLSHGVLNSVYALLGKDAVVDPVGKFDLGEQDISDLIASLLTRHDL